MIPAKKLLLSWQSWAAAIGVFCLKLFVAWYVLTFLGSKFHPLQWLKELTLA